MVIEFVHNFFVNVSVELLTTVKTSKVHTALGFVNFVQVNGELDLLVTGLVGDFALPIVARHLVLVKIFLVLKVLDESHEDLIGATGGEELILLTHALLELFKLTRLLLLNMLFTDAEVIENVKNFFVVTFTTSNSATILLLATSLTALALFSLNSSIDIGLSNLEFLLDISLRRGCSLHPWVRDNSSHVRSVSRVDLHNVLEKVLEFF